MSFKKVKKLLVSINIQNVSKGTVVRGILVVVFLINYILSATGYSPLKVSESEIGKYVTIILTAGTFLAAYWKNNSWTDAAQQADDKYQDIKSGSED